MGREWPAGALTRRERPELSYLRWSRSGQERALGKDPALASIPRKRRTSPYQIVRGAGRRPSGTEARSGRAARS